jgi:hypothetical protein
MFADPHVDVLADHVQWHLIAAEQKLVGAPPVAKEIDVLEQARTY